MHRDALHDVQVEVPNFPLFFFLEIHFPQP